MAKITVNNPKNVINSKIGKNYFKLVGTGGPKGDKGDKGDTGTAATISAGTASSLPAGSSPTVTNSGTSSAAVFNFGIPKGDKGDKGDTGETGPTGPTGLDGQAATVTVGTVTTGAPGTSATVVNSGTTSAAVLDFTIPRGDKGESGSGTGDMVKADYDANNAVADAGGIASYVEANAAHIEGVNSLPATGADETLYLTSDEQKSTGSATGSAIQIQTDGQASILDFEMQGNAGQTTYSGKNLLPFTDQSFTLNGITYSVQNGSLYMNGNSTGEIYSSNNAFKTSFAFTLQAGTYTFSLPETEAGITSYIDNTASATHLATVNGSTLKSASFTLSEPTAVHLGFYIYNAHPTNKRMLLQLEAGSTATAYEPYVGGIASPNPDYPQAVNTTTGENVVKIEGKNLLDTSNMDFATSTTGLTITHESDGSITLNGTLASSYNIRVNATNLIKNLSGKTITLSVATSGTGNWRNFGIKKRAGWDVLVVSKAQGDTKTGSFVDDGSEYIFDLYGNPADGTTFSNFNVKLQIEFGSPATPYEPYQGEDYEVNLGKNLFDKNSVTRIYAYFPSGTSWRYYNDSYSIRIPCQPNTKYTLTANNPSETIFRAGVTDSDTIPVSGTDVTVYSTTRYSNTNTPIYLTTGANAKYIVVQVAEGTASDTFDTMMLELGTATAYAPYFTPIELAKIGTYQDRIYKNDGKWYVEKQVGKVVLDGSETWFLGQTLTNTVHFNIGDFTTILTGAVVPDETQVGLCLSDHFEEKANLYGIDQVGIDLHSNKNLIVGVPSSIATTVAGFTTWLSTHPTTVYYALATPVDEEITNEALIEQLDAIVSANLPQGVVNISLTGTGAQGCMVVEYEIGPEINYGYVYLNGKYVSLGGGGGSTEGLAEVALTGDYDDLINQPTIPTKTSDLTNDSGYLTSAGAVTSFNGSTGAVTYAAPVTSVNGSTGAVTVNVPTKTSDLNNDSGFLTSSTGVTSVNGNTGAVTVTVPTATSDLNNDSGFISTSDTGTVSTTMLANGAVTSAKLGLTSSTLPSIAWDSGTVAGTSGLEGLVYADLVIINDAYVARSQTAWNANWQNIGTLPTGYRPKTQTIFPAIFTDINSGNVTGYGRVRFNTSGVIDAKANATVSNAYCCFSGVFVTV